MQLRRRIPRDKAEWQRLADEIHQVWAAMNPAPLSGRVGISYLWKDALPHTIRFEVNTAMKLIAALPWLFTYADPYVASARCEIGKKWEFTLTIEEA